MILLKYSQLFFPVTVTPIIAGKCKAVGISSTGIISDSRMRASSEYSSSYKAFYGRLNGNRGDGWCSKSSSSSNEWLQIDFGKTVVVCGVATQGDISGNEWTTDFKLSFSADGSSWTTYKDEHGVEVVMCVCFCVGVYRFATI